MALTRQEVIDLIAAKLEPEHWAILDSDDIAAALAGAHPPHRLAFLASFNRRSEKEIGERLLVILRPVVEARARAAAEALLDANDKIAISDVGRLFAPRQPPGAPA